MDSPDYWKNLVNKAEANYLNLRSLSSGCSMHLAGPIFEENGKSLVRCVACRELVTLTQVPVNAISIDDVKILLGEAMALAEGIEHKKFDSGPILAHYSDIIKKLEENEKEIRQIRSMVDIAARLIEKKMGIEISGS